MLKICLLIIMRLLHQDMVSLPLGLLESFSPFNRLTFKIMTAYYSPGDTILCNEIKITAHCPLFAARFVLSREAGRGEGGKMEEEKLLA